jgi:hypothetical protein
MLRLSLAALVSGSMLGGALLAVPSDALRIALGRFPESAFWFAGIEILFSAACIAALVVCGERLYKRPYLSMGLALLSSSNLLYHFPPLMAVIGELAADPLWSPVPRVDRAALLRLWLRPEVLALWMHFVLASLAAAPIVAIWRSADAGPTSHGIIRRLGGAALAATLLQIPVGLWLLMTTDRAAQDALLGGDILAGLCFAGGVLGAMWLLQTLAAVTFGGDRSAATRAGYLLVAITVLMTATLRSTRNVAAEPSHSSTEIISVHRLPTPNQ